MTQYTLVQHSNYVQTGNPEFEHGVEEAAVTVAQATAILKSGGVVFDDYKTAYDTAMATNYPEGHVGIIPAAKGRFSARQIDGAAVFIPERQTVSA